MLATIMLLLGTVLLLVAAAPKFGWLPPMPQPLLMLNTVFGIMYIAFGIVLIVRS